VEKAQLELKDLTPVETTVMHRLRGLFSLQLDQPAEAVKSLEAAWPSTRRACRTS
jgi:hypothetical protein